MGDPYVIYGDPAYRLTRNILAPFRGVQLTDDQQEFNSRMSKLRVSVEWGIWQNMPVVWLFRFQEESENFAPANSKYYLVAAVLANCHTCLCGSETSTFFGLDPPELEDYLSNT